MARKAGITCELRLSQMPTEDRPNLDWGIHLNSKLCNLSFVAALGRLLRSVLVIIIAVMLSQPVSGALSASEAVEKGRTFLIRLHDAELGLMPEYRGANIYWLFHDNYLAAKVLSVSHSNLSQSITAAIKREGIHKSGKIEILFGEAETPFPFRQYQLIDVRKAGQKIIRTEVVTDGKLEGWKAYADLLLLACIAEHQKPEAKQYWEAAMQLWDGKGFFDAAAKHHGYYSTYKLGLAMIAAKRLSPPTKLPDRLLETLLRLQDESGGWITDYDPDYKPLGLANVETTCLSILGIEALARYPANSATKSK
jgi:hypothetical protein